MIIENHTLITNLTIVTSTFMLLLASKTQLLQ